MKISAKKKTVNDDTNEFCCIVPVAISFHVPYYLMAKELGYLGSFKDKTGDIS